MLAVGMGNCCYVTDGSAAQGASTPTWRREGRGHIVAAARLQLVDSELYSRDRRFSRGRLETATCCSVKHYLFTSTFKIDVLCPTPLTFYLKWEKIETCSKETTNGV